MIRLVEFFALAMDVEVINMAYSIPKANRPVRVAGLDIMLPAAHYFCRIDNLYFLSHNSDIKV